MQSAVERDAERDPERDFEAAFAPVIEMPAAQASSEVIDPHVETPVMEYEPMPPVAFLEESPAVEPMAAAPMAERHTESMLLLLSFSLTRPGRRSHALPGAAYAFQRPVKPNGCR